MTSNVPGRELARPATIRVQDQGEAGVSDVAWDAFVASCPASTFYHTTAFRAILERCFPVRCRSLAATSDGSLIGVLPVVHQKSLLFGNRVTSSPFTTYGGPLGHAEGVAPALLRAATEWAEGLGARVVEVRARDALELPPDDRWAVVPRKATMIVDVDQTPDQLLASFSANRRNKVRRTLRGELAYQDGGLELVGAFYDIYARNMRDLGTPAYPRSFLEALVERSDGRYRIALVRADGVPAAGAVAGRWGDTLELPLISSLRELENLYPSTFLYWSAMNQARDAGAKRLDLGRSTPGSGTHAFKAQFGATEHPLPWAYWTPHGGAPPSLNKENEKFKLFIEVWRRLPLWVANRLGPLLSSRLY